MGLDIPCPRCKSTQPHKEMEYYSPKTGRRGKASLFLKYVGYTVQCLTCKAIHVFSLGKWNFLGTKGDMRIGSGYGEPAIMLTERNDIEHTGTARAGNQQQQ